MARAVAAVLLAGLCAGSVASASECRSLDDGMALPQKAVRLHLDEAELEDKPGMAPSHSRMSKNRKLIRESVDGAFKRAIKELNLPDAVGVFRWEVVGKVTQALMKEYQSPKSPALLGLLDDIILLAHDTLGQTDVMTIKEADMIKRLANVTRAADIAQHFVDRMESPPKTLTSIVSAVTEAAHGDPSQLKYMSGNATLLVAEKVAQDVVASVKKTSPEAAELVSYAVDVGFGKKTLDTAHLLDLHVPLLQVHGAPPAVLDYIKEEADRQRNHITLSADERHSKVMNMMSTSAKQLGLPPVFSEIVETMGKASQTPLNTQEEKNAVMYELNELVAKANDQVGGPHAISELIHRVGGVLKGQPMPSTLERVELIAKATAEIGLPSAVGDILKYTASTEGNQTKKLDAATVQDLASKLIHELGAPDAVSEFANKLTMLALSDGGKVAPDQVMSLMTTLFEKLQLPGIRTLTSFFSTAMKNGTVEKLASDPAALMPVVQAMATSQAEFNKLQGIFNGMADRLLNPVRVAHQHTMEKLFGGMKKPSNFHAAGASA